MDSKLVMAADEYFAMDPFSPPVGNSVMNVALAIPYYAIDILAANPYVLTIDQLFTLVWS